MPWLRDVFRAHGEERGGVMIKTHYVVIQTDAGEWREKFDTPPEEAAAFDREQAED